MAMFVVVVVVVVERVIADGLVGSEKAGSFPRAEAWRWEVRDEGLGFLKYVGEERRGEEAVLRCHERFWLSSGSQERRHYNYVRGDGKPTTIRQGVHCDATM